MNKKATRQKRINTQFKREDFENGDLMRIAELSGYSASMIYKVLGSGIIVHAQINEFARKYLAAKKKLKEELICI